MIIWLCTAALSAFGFRHSIAGAVEAFHRAFTGSASWGEMVFSFVVPAVIGNTVGGVTLLAPLSHAHVKAELPPRPHTQGAK